MYSIIINIDSIDYEQSTIRNKQRIFDAFELLPESQFIYRLIKNLKNELWNILITIIREQDVYLINALLAFLLEKYQQKALDKIHKFYFKGNQIGSYIRIDEIRIENKGGAMAILLYISYIDIKGLLTTNIVKDFVSAKTGLLGSIGRGIASLMPGGLLRFGVDAVVNMIQDNSECITGKIQEYLSENGIILSVCNIEICKSDYSTFETMFDEKLSKEFEVDVIEAIRKILKSIN